ncbi:MAG TPA: extracellular solute-binding protein [Candidatus Limnocylindrales bacterium]|nr:extracellular solute-binding protein [Candidatus Limnocylindrales bacterium]
MTHRAAGLCRLLAVTVLLAACGPGDGRSPGASASTGPSDGAAPSAVAEPVTLRVQVSLTPQELASFTPAIEAIDDRHPEWIIRLEPVPQDAEIEKITNALAGDDLADVVRVQGLTVQQWIRRGAFLDLTARMATDGPGAAELYPGPLEQFRWQERTWGVPDSASPEIVFFNRSMFEAAGLAEPTADWTYDDMRAAAVRLTLDASGRHPGEPGFDPEAIRQWGWNGGLTYFWQDAFVRALGGALCANDDCTVMSFTDPATAAAVEWWVTLVRDDHAALWDPYGGSQTGVPGDPFLAGAAAMGSNGAFALGQLDAAGTIDYGVLPPLVGRDGSRHTALSTAGYVIGAGTAHPDAAWALVRELTAVEFLAATWGRPGHGVPARIAAAATSLEGAASPELRAAILEAMAVGRVFRPYTASAFQAFAGTVDIFRQMNTGVTSVADGLEELEAVANSALATDRTP